MPAEASELVDSLPDLAVMVEPNAGIMLSPDPKDNYLIGTAIAGRADAIVSGDKRHMISLTEVAGIPIITARQALDRLDNAGRSA